MKHLKKALVALLLVAQNIAVANCGTNSNTNCEPCCATTDCSSEKCCDLIKNDNVYGKTFYAYRPQDSNAARGLAGVADKMHLFAKEEFYGQASVYLGWQQTTKGGDFARYFSFTGNPTMTYGELSDGTFDIFGLQFGTTASGTISFCPQIQNFIANIDLYFGLDEFVCGLWSRLQVPVVYTRWDMGLSDPKPSAIGTNYLAGTVTLESTTTPIKYKSLKAAWADTTGTGFGKVSALGCGKIACRQTDTAVAGVHFDLGYDFIRKERGHLGASLHVVAPSGTTPSANYLFNAVAGANHSWQLGGSVNAAYELWNDCDGDKKLSLYLDAYVTHLFAGKQRRLLGLKTTTGKSNPGASFLVLKKFSATGVVDTTTPLVRATDILCCDVKVSADVMADIALMLQYDYGNWSAGLGWNFWLRTREVMNNRCCSIDKQKYGIANLGTYRDGAGSTALATLTDTPLNTNTASQSTIGKTQGTAGITTVGGEAFQDTATVYLKDTDVDVCAALHPQAISNKIFGFAGYNWSDCEWQPFVSVYGGYELGNDNTAANQWEIGVKGGVAF